MAEKDSTSLCGDIYSVHSLWYSADTTDSPCSFRITTNSIYCLFLIQWELLSFVVFSCFNLLDSYCEIHASKPGYRWMLLICFLALFRIGSIETYSAFFFLIRCSFQAWKNISVCLRLQGMAYSLVRYLFS